MTDGAVSSASTVGGSHAGSLPSITDRDICPHCRAQQCVLVCPTFCYSRRNDGRVNLDVSPCIGCGACVMICYEYTNIAWRTNPSPVGR